jgi:hypothetical protein
VRTLFERTDVVGEDEGRLSSITHSLEIGSGRPSNSIFEEVDVEVEVEIESGRPSKSIL